MIGCHRLELAHPTPEVYQARHEFFLQHSNLIRTSPQKNKIQSYIFYRIFFPEHARPLPGDGRVAAVPVVAADGGRPHPK